jgi:threonine-phosphate decarboxylase
MGRIRPPWSVNVLAEQAALAAIDDREHADATRAFVQQERAWLSREISLFLNTVVWRSQANFLYVEIPYASDLVRFAEERNILIRDCTRWPGCQQSSIRIAVRRRWESERLLALWREFLCEDS